MDATAHFFVQFTVLGDTYPQKHIVKSINYRNFCIWRERCSAFWAPAWPLAWPGPQDGLGQGGRLGSKNGENVKALRMEFSMMETLNGLQCLLKPWCVFLGACEAPVGMATRPTLRGLQTIEVGRLHSHHQVELKPGGNESRKVQDLV